MAKDEIAAGCRLPHSFTLAGWDRDLDRPRPTRVVYAHADGSVEVREDDVEVMAGRVTLREGRWEVTDLVDGWVSQQLEIRLNVIATSDVVERLALDLRRLRLERAQGERISRDRLLHYATRVLVTRFRHPERRERLDAIVKEHEQQAPSLALRLLDADA